MSIHPEASALFCGWPLPCGCICVGPLDHKHPHFRCWFAHPATVPDSPA